jgi:dCMP deaminase
LKEKFIKAYMETAEVFANLSHAKRLKVGAIVVKDDRITSIGYNGTPAGWDNVCEDDNYRTIAEVIHAEANAISKLARSQESGDNSTMFITHAPCVECSKLIYTSGIKKVYFKNYYRDQGGLEFLKKCNVEVEQVNA